MKSKVFTLLMATALLVACSKGKETDEQIEEPMSVDCSAGEVSDMGISAGIINGKKVKSNSWIESQTALLTVPNAEGNLTICTVALVSRDIILTAAHCVNEREFKTKGVVIFGANPSCDSANLRKERKISVEDVIIHPDFNDKITGANDLALVRLGRNAPKGFTPAQVADSEDFKGLNESSTHFVAVGYGNTRGFGIKYTHWPRLRTTSISSLNTKKEKMGEREITDLAFEQKESGICSGDSGGPFYAKIGKKPVIIGVNSAVQKRSESGEPCKGLAVAMSIENHRSFLQKAFDELAPEQKNPF